MNSKPKIGKADMAAWLAKHGDWEERVTHLVELVDLAFEAGRKSKAEEICAASWHRWDARREKCGVCGLAFVSITEGKEQKSKGKK